MNNIIRGEEIEKITRNIFSDLEGGKRIDEINIYNKPNKAEVHELIQDRLLSSEQAGLSGAGLLQEKRHADRRREKAGKLSDL